MTSLNQSHYNEDYFNGFQKTIGEFGGWANKTKFEAYIKKTDEVLDFGCGGGFLLQNLNCQKKVGVEINQTAALRARENGLEVYSSSEAVPENYVDVIISNNALEHTHNPLAELKNLYKKLRPGGKIIFIVPCENISFSFHPNSVDQHLYSWSPMCAGNLFALAGFTVIESLPYIHKWPPHYRKIAKLGGRTLFDLCCKIYGKYIERTWYQVRIVAEKKIS